ncbi:hypothetical protein ACQUZE_08785, partial [Streptococcus pyogenes]|uniref:hypothetical protein n=1 Tax=Streptococcus pyogenes TaxID=1314 RepID=UPI003DA00C8D
VIWQCGARTTTFPSKSASQTMELIVDYRKWMAEHAPIHIDRFVVEQVKSFEFLCVHFTKE